MALNFGNKPKKNKNPSSSDLQGMSKKIYDYLRPDFVDKALDAIDETKGDDTDEKQLDEAKKNIVYNIKQMSFFIAKGVIEHIKDEMEIKGVKARLDSPVVSTTVAPGILVATAGTPAAQTGATTSPGTGTGNVSNPSVSQSNSGKGLVK